MQYRQPYLFGLSTGIQICLGIFLISSHFSSHLPTYDSIGRAYIMYTRVWKLSTKRTLYINPFNTTYLYKKNVCKQCRPQISRPVRLISKLHICIDAWCGLYLERTAQLPSHSAEITVNYNSMPLLCRSCLQAT